VDIQGGLAMKIGYFWY